ncbi:hypothetical protein ABBQ38_001122 [Trebouxia sp. C0009 RCD-2024]
MAELRLAKAFMRRVAVYAEEHAIDLAAPRSDAIDVRDSSMGIRQDGTSTALRIVKLQACAALAERSTKQQGQHEVEQQQVAAATALQPVLAVSFGQADTAIARQHDLCKVSDCIAALLLPHISSSSANARERVQNSFASIFSAASLPRLASLSKLEREVELKHVADITLEGVNVEGQMDLENHLQLLEDTKQRCTLQQHALQDYTDAVVHRGSSEAPQEAIMLQLTEELAYVHQAYALCQALRDHLAASLGRIGQHHREQEQGLRELQGLVGAALAVPKEVVQPAFEALGRRHLVMLAEQQQLQLQPALVAAVTRCIDADMPQLAKELAAPGAASSIMPLAPITDDSQGPKNPIDMAAAEAASGVVRIAASDAPDSAISHLSLAGFCPVSFVKRSGLLMKVDATVGFVRYEDQHFGCANQEFLNCFAASPQEYMDAVMTQAVQHPACIALLNLQSCFRDLSLDKLIEAVEAEPETLDGACQTELHPIAKHMDYNYEWNEWGHRRKALNMVNLRQKRTHGSQTILSHFRRENATQVCYRAIKVSDIVTPIIAVCL